MISHRKLCVFTLFYNLINIVFADQCVSIPSNSPCLIILPYSYAYIHSDRSIDLESFGPYMWSSLLLGSPSMNDTCSRSVASWMCSMTYKNCMDTIDETTLSCERMTLISSSDHLEELVYSLVSSLSSFGPQSMNCSSTTYNHSNNITKSIIELPRSDIFTITQPRCEPYSIEDGLCDGVVDRNVFVPPMMTQTLIESRITKYHQILPLAPVLTGCRDRLSELICTQAYMICDISVLQRSLNIQIPVPFPQVPCQNTCQLVNSSCQNIPLELDCSSYSEVETIFGRLGGQLLVTQCILPVNETDLQISNSLSCPRPLILTIWPQASDNNLNGGSCSTPCPNLVWSQNQWQIAETLVLICTILSFVGTSLALVTWKCFSSRRKQHSSLWMFMICQWLISFSFVIGYFINYNNGGLRNIGCKTESVIFTQNETGSSVQGVFLLFSVLASVAWWTILVFHLFVQIVLEYRWNKHQLKIVNRIYHLFSWMIASVLCIAALSLDSIGRGSSSPWILFRDGAVGDSFYQSEFALFYLPIMVMGGIGVLMMIAILVRLIIHKHNNIESRSAVGRPIMFVILFLFLVCFLCVYRFWMFTHQLEYENSVVEWLTCLMTTDNPLLCGIYTGDDSRPPIHPPVLLWYILIVCCVGEGAITATFYLSQASVWKDWVSILHKYSINQVVPMNSVA